MANEMERARRFAHELTEAYQGALHAVVLYGSAARGDYTEGVSDLNVLVLLRAADPPALRRGSALARRWVAEGNPPPLMLGVEEWRRSADVFAIELSDMQEAHVVLAGADPFEGVRVDRADLRRQCERELKGKHIQLREGYLLAAESRSELDELVRRSLPTFLVLFRSVLRLGGEDGAREPETVIRRTAEQVGFDPNPLLAISRARQGVGELQLGAESPVVLGYLDAVARTVEFVDRLPV